MHKKTSTLEWHNSTITIVFPSTLRNALVLVKKHNATTPNQSTTDDNVIASLLGAFEGNGRAPIAAC